MTTSPYLAFAPNDLIGSVPATHDVWRALPFADVRSVIWPHADAAVRVLVLHGGGGNADAMAPIAALAHAAGAEVVVPDLPGYGRTRPARRGRVVYDHWVATGQALAEADDRPLLIVGLSIGGMLAYDVAATAGRAAAVVATCLLDPRRREVREAVSRTPAMGRYGPSILTALRSVLDPIRVPISWTGDMAKVANDPELARRCLSDRSGAGARVPLGFLRSWMSSTRPTPAENFTVCPVVLAHPAQDRWTPPALSVEFLRRIAAPARLQMLDGAGHFPVEQPGAGQLARVLRDVIHNASDAPH